MELTNVTASDNTSPEVLCLFCGQGYSSNAIAGEMLSRGDVSVHQNCLYFSSGLLQSSDLDKDGSISGFLVEDIIAEIKRATRKGLHCSVCKRRGLFIGCSGGKSCRKGGHFPCLYENDFLFQHYGSFDAYCCQHAPTQPPIDIPNEECCICLASFSSHRLLYCVVCKTTFHRTCVQKQGLASGIHFFRCPTCNNKEQYTSEMLRMGVAIPDRDAQWEMGNYYDDLLEEFNKFCQAEECKCPMGRNHHSTRGKYKLCKCFVCGQWLGHIHCLPRRLTECYVCAKINQKINSKQSCALPPTNSNSSIDEHSKKTLTCSGSYGNISLANNSCHVVCSDPLTDISGGAINSSSPVMSPTVIGCSRNINQVATDTSRQHKKRSICSRISGSLSQHQSSESQHPVCRRSVRSNRPVVSYNMKNINFLAYNKHKSKLNFSLCLVVHRLSGSEILAFKQRSRRCEKDRDKFDSVSIVLENSFPIVQGAIHNSLPVPTEKCTDTEQLTCKAQESPKAKETNYYWIITKPSSYREFAFCFAKIRSEQ